MMLFHQHRKPGTMSWTTLDEKDGSPIKYSVVGMQRPSKDYAATEQAGSREVHRKARTPAHLVKARGPCTRPGCPTKLHRMILCLDSVPSIMHKWIAKQGLLEL